MAIVYRMEYKYITSKTYPNKINKGPYSITDSQTGVLLGDYLTKGGMYHKHPAPDRDPIISKVDWVNKLVFCFDSYTDLADWFLYNSERVQYVVELDIARIGVYEVPDEHYTKGVYQSVADPEYMTLIRTYNLDDVGDIMNIHCFQREKLIRDLNKLLNGSITDTEKGICYNLHELSYMYCIDGYEVVEIYCSEWDHFSGNKSWPINLPYIGNKWEGEQRELRHSLIKHIIKKLEEEINSN